MSRDMYPRPDRDEIARRVRAEQPPADDLDDVAARREPERSAVANFAVHLSARLRALGWDSAALADKTGLTKVSVTRAVNGVPVGLDIAERLALAVGGYLATMIGPYMCSTCHGEPPAGYGCLECGAETRAS